MVVRLAADLKIQIEVAHMAGVSEENLIEAYKVTTRLLRETASNSQELSQESVISGNVVPMLAEQVAVADERVYFLVK